MKEKYTMIPVTTLLIFGFVLLAAIMAWPTQFLWNSCLVPAVTFANPIGFWQALGLNLLASILFKTVSPSKSN